MDGCVSHHFSIRRAPRRLQPPASIRSCRPSIQLATKRCPPPPSRNSRTRATSHSVSCVAAQTDPACRRMFFWSRLEFSLFYNRSNAKNRRPVETSVSGARHSLHGAFCARGRVRARENRCLLRRRHSSLRASDAEPEPSPRRSIA